MPDILCAHRDEDRLRLSFNKIVELSGILGFQIKGDHYYNIEITDSNGICLFKHGKPSNESGYTTIKFGLEGFGGLFFRVFDQNFSFNYSVDDIFHNTNEQYICKLYFDYYNNYKIIKPGKGKIRELPQLDFMVCTNVSEPNINLSKGLTTISVSLSGGDNEFPCDIGSAVLYHDFDHINFFKKLTGPGGMSYFNVVNKYLSNEDDAITEIEKYFYNSMERLNIPVTDNMKLELEKMLKIVRFSFTRLNTHFDFNIGGYTNALNDIIRDYESRILDARSKINYLTQKKNNMISSEPPKIIVK